ncbi:MULTISPECIES: hypothetical protein [Rhizobium]|uniref:Cytidine deaminase n=1 Tax=Rhizobium rhododendri TaxID=2506430 RepID=A0ABY8IE07_9HYPH|nr:MULTISPECIES: hypothetical protein [Rhizobium]MBZ5758778.1 hypothetical protein [Rhizobium sp. VS19-DR96]MBZ5764392.1 hypothetical protein [Rhizobium sp. VS19-DR129.2]MBZ5771935.1 hypothetical protein [Rhizobium sp. VS19-DRK62.2]MBZ5783378.1 hypothetical protein [Rhizobium sp. VS19-DR121]MBZ5800826.1 hypothetical protein [Rhizobium sp. VS19-DR181]
MSEDRIALMLDRMRAAASDANRFAPYGDVIAESGRRYHAAAVVWDEGLIAAPFVPPDCCL